MWFKDFSRKYWRKRNVFSFCFLSLKRRKVRTGTKQVHFFKFQNMEPLFFSFSQQSSHTLLMRIAIGKYYVWICASRKASMNNTRNGKSNGSTIMQKVTQNKFPFSGNAIPIVNYKCPDLTTSIRSQQSNTSLGMHYEFVKYILISFVYCLSFEDSSND